MEEAKLKRQIGANIALCRKRAGLTQAELAEKLNYSDKAISKWERGESVPDVVTLVQLARTFELPVNSLLEAPGEPEQASAVPETEQSGRRADRGVIQMLTSVLVWFVALLVFVVLATLGLSKSWVCFLYAVPVNAIVLLSLRSAWRQFSWNQALISVIVWGSLASIYASLLVFASFNAWRIFMLGIPGQVAIYLWFRLFRSPEQEEEHG